MRDLLNLLDLFEAQQPPNTQELDAFKDVIAARIKQLPDDDVTAKALREIEDLLKNVNAGGKMGIINGKLAAIQDPTVDAAQKELARYILSMDMTPADRDQLFDLWSKNKLVKTKVLLSPGKKNFSQIITNYDTNPAIRELSNELMRISALGQGKGEFGLSVMSKSINKQEGKGDLLIDGRDVEVKTTDGGAGRFTDQEVRPGPGFDKAARELDAFIRQKFYIPKSGANLDVLTDLYQSFYQNWAHDPKLRKKLIDLITEVIQNIFKGQNVSSIINAIKSGNVNAAKQEYAKTNFDYYMSKKKDEGVLYISLVKDPIMTVFFKDADELAASGLRLHAGTAYITSVSDVRLPYPQIEIVDTKAGPSAASGKVADNVPIAKAATSAADLDTVTSTPKLTGPGAKAARTTHEPRMDRATLGRERRTR
jgi:hypothetical protein